MLSDYVASTYAGADFAVVSPDAGRIKVAEQWSRRLGGAPLAFVHKTRDINRPNETVANRVVGDVAGRLCVLVDDMIDTGARSPRPPMSSWRPGRLGVVVAATHAILSGRRPTRLRGHRGYRHQHAADPPDRQFPSPTVLSIAPLISRAIKEVFEDGSVTKMFDGGA